MFVLRAFGPDGRLLSVEKSRFPHVPIRIGRNPLNDFSVQDGLISGFHARIEDDHGRICIRDLGSTNGVYLPSAPGKSPVRIEPNVSVDLGPSKLWFFLAWHIRVQLEVVDQQAPLRGAHANGAVLGNPSMIALPGLRSGAPGPRGASEPPGRAVAQAGKSSANLAGAGSPQPRGASEAPRQISIPVGTPAGKSPLIPISASSPPGHGHSVDALPSAAPQRPSAMPGQAPTPGALPFLPSAMAGGMGAGDAAPARPPNADHAPATQAFRIDLETLALQGLRELALSLVPGRQLDTTGDVARFITKLHDSLDVFCRSFIPLRQGHEQFISSLDLQHSARQRVINRSPSAMALEEAQTPEAVAIALLDPHERTFDAPEAVEGILADLMLHQVALLDGVMEGVRSLLDELSPENIEAAAEQGGTAGLFGSKHRVRWLEFCQRFERLSEGQQAFSYVFGQNFAEVYRQYWHRKATEDGGLRTDHPRG